MPWWFVRVCCFKTLFAFEADATALVPDVLDVDFEDEYEELEADLQEFSEKFADSPAAQVCATAKTFFLSNIRPKALGLLFTLYFLYIA